MTTTRLLSRHAAVLQPAAGAIALFACAVLLTACASTGDQAPRLRSDGTFVYPAAAQDAHTQGYAVVAFDIDANGRVEAPHVVDAQPNGVFDDAALAYVAGRVYEPAKKDGHPAAVIGQRARINFKLGEAAGYSAD